MVTKKKDAEVQVRSANQQCMMQDVLQKKSHRMARGRAPGWSRGHLNKKLMTRGQPCKDLRTEQSKESYLEMSMVRSWEREKSGVAGAGESWEARQMKGH